VSQFKYFETTAANQNMIQEKINKRLNSGNACHHSAQDVWPPRLLTKNIQIRINWRTIVSVVLNGGETYPLSVRVEYRLEGISEQGVWDIILKSEGWNIVRMEKVHIEELKNLCFSLNLIRMIMSWRTK
jgi:hypothetical protein